MTKEMRKVIRVCFEQGREYLDKEIPHWRQDILVHMQRTNREFDMRSCYNCVLGHLFGTFSSGTYYFNLSTMRAQSKGLDLDVHSLSKHEGDECWNYLNSLWQEELTKGA